MSIIESKSKTAQEKFKRCTRCGKKVPLKDFYVNKDWQEQEGKDAWCKECVNKCGNKEEILEYFWENRRKWDDKIWTSAETKASKQASSNSVYQKTSDERRERILEKLTCQLIPSIMFTMYTYEPHIRNGKDIPYEDAKKEGLIISDTRDRDIKVYSKEFNGYFKKAELEYLHDYYEGLEHDFDLNDTNLRDIAKKLAKASLQADKAQDDYMAGKCDFSVVKDALSQFDLLSKSGNFAACKRKPGEDGGMSSWSELTMMLETTGHPCTRKIEWPKDSVDEVIEEYRHIVEALELDN